MRIGTDIEKKEKETGIAGCLKKCLQYRFFLSGSICVQSWAGLSVRAADFRQKN